MTYVRQAPEFQLRGSRSGTRALGLDRTAGTRRAPSRPRSATLPGRRHGLDVEGFLPTVWTGSPISSEAAHLSASLVVAMGLRARPACPRGPGSLPNSLRPVSSPRSRQQLKEIWGSRCLHLWSPEFTGQRPQNRKCTLGHGGHCEPTGTLGNEGRARGCTPSSGGGEGEPRACWEGERRGRH